MSHAGWLQKRSAESFHNSESHGSSVINRYCVLCGPFLLDFIDKVSLISGHAPKREAEVIGVAPWDENNIKNVKMFIVMTKFGGPIVCTTLDTSNRDEWMASIQQVLSSTIGPLLEELEVVWSESLAKKQQQQHQQQQNFVMDPPQPLESDTCQRTGAPFGITLSRYNCVSCGDACCYEACSQEITLVQYGFESPKRICDDCYLAQLLLLHTKLMFRTLENAALQHRMICKGIISSMPALTRKYITQRNSKSLLAGMDLLERQMMSDSELSELYITEEKFTRDEAVNSTTFIRDSLMERMSGDATLGLIKLLHDSAQSERFTVEQFYQVIQQLHRVAEDDLGTIGFYWPQLVHTHYLMVPVVSEEAILKAELLEDFILTMCRKSAHLAVKLIWLLNGNLEDMATEVAAGGGSGSGAINDAAGKKVNIIRLAIEVEDAMLSAAMEEGADASILYTGVLQSLIKPTGAQSSLLADQIILLRQAREAVGREYGFKFYAKTSLPPSPSPNNSGISRRRLNTTTTFSLPSNTIFLISSASSSLVLSGDTASAKAFYFECQLEFIKAIVGIADALRFVEPPSARASKLKSEIRNVLEGGGDPTRRLTGFVPVCMVTEKLQPIVRIPEDEGHVFQTKERAPTLYVFEVLREGHTMTRIKGSGGIGGGAEMNEMEENSISCSCSSISNSSYVSQVLERSCTEVKGEENVEITKAIINTTHCHDTIPLGSSDPSVGRYYHPQMSGSNSDEGCDPRPKLAAPCPVQDIIYGQNKSDIGILKNSQQQLEDLNLTIDRTTEAAVCNLDNHDNHWVQAGSSLVSVATMYPAVYLALGLSDNSLDRMGVLRNGDTTMYPVVCMALHLSESVDQMDVLRNVCRSSTDCGGVEEEAQETATAEFSVLTTVTNNNGVKYHCNDDVNTVMNDLEKFSSLPQQPADTCNLSDVKPEPDEKNCAVSIRTNEVAAPSSMRGSQSRAGNGRRREWTKRKDTFNDLKYVIASLHSYSEHALMRTIRPATKSGTMKGAGGSSNALSAKELNHFESEYSTSQFESPNSGSGKEQDVDKGLSPAVLEARDLFKDGYITAEELQTVLTKDSAFLELIEEHAFLDTQFCVNLAFGENWASKRSRIRETSPYGNLPGWDLVSLIAKSNDDLRQEVCALQLIQLFQRVFEEAGLDVLWLKPYQIISTGARTGLLQTLTDTQSLDGLKKRGGFTNLRNYFEKTYSGTERQLKEAQKNFLRSLAAYSLICYVLQVKDRHNGNILISSDGHIIHIDFGWLLGIAPGGSFSLESSPFKLTTEYVDVLGGLESELFFEFVTLFTKGMLVLQAAHERIVGLVEMLIDRSPYPCFQRRDKSSIIDKLRSRLMPDISQHKMVGVCLNLIKESLNSVGTAQVK